MQENDDPFDKRLNEALKRNDLDLSGGKVVPEPQEVDDSFNQASSGLAYGMRLGIEFLAGTVVGFLMGWGIDSYFDTVPWFILLFTLLGFGAGILNVYRVINNLEEGIGINARKTLTKPVKSPKQHSTD